MRRERVETNEAEKKLDTWKTNCFLEREKSAVLRERIHGLTRVETLQNISRTCRVPLHNVRVTDVKGGGGGEPR